MTTHLHPDGLPLDDTPITDKLEDGCIEINEMSWATFADAAQQLERDKRRAEAQLAVAIKCLKSIKSYDSDVYDPINQALEEIKALGSAGTGNEVTGGGE